MQALLDKIANSPYVLIGLAGFAFLIALWLVIVIVRMVTGGRLRFNGGRTRQARLGIVDAFDLDRQRQLIIVRRDNTEHLIMIGGPNDLVIESEIVRIEARDNRRAIDKSDGFADSRVPAPTMPPDGAPSAIDEPLLPLQSAPVPITDRPRRQADTAAPADPVLDPLPPRTPTFPLPRRPAPEPERRPPPLPESASRTDEPAPIAPPPPRSAAPVLPPSAPAKPFPAPFTPAPTAAEAVTPSPVETFPAPPPIPPQPLPPIVPTQGTDVPPRPVRPPPPSFLKPLPPRPPIRPLRRATPVAPGAPTIPDAASPPPEAVAPSSLEPDVPSLPSATVSAPAAETPASPPPEPPPPAEPPVAPLAEPKPKETDALESLEEEMAKLLGRG